MKLSFVRWYAVMRLGFVRWYDERDGEGVIEDLDGKDFYFTSWSFPKTFYRVTGICKKTKRKKTIKTRRLPGMFLDYIVVNDPVCKKLKSGVAVRMLRIERFPGTMPWATRICVDKTLTAKKRIIESRLLDVLESLVIEKNSDWRRYLGKRLEDLLKESDEI